MADIRRVGNFWNYSAQLADLPLGLVRLADFNDTLNDWFG